MFTAIHPTRVAVIAAGDQLYRGSKVDVSADGTVTIIDRKHETDAMTKTRYHFTRGGPAVIWEDE